MKATILITLALVGFANAQNARNDYMASLTRSAAERIQRIYGVTVDTSQATLSQLNELEILLSSCSRIERTYGLRFDYRTSSLAALLDVESRLSAAARLKRTYSLECDYRSYTLSQLLDFESRIGAAQRVNRQYATTLDWRSLSLSQILAQERQLYTTSHPQPAPLYSGNTYTASPSASSYTTSSAGYYSRRYDYNYRPPVGDHYVAPHIRSDGSYVQGHMKTDSDDSFWNNWSSSGNTNPYTGSTGTKQPPYTFRKYTTTKLPSLSLPKLPKLPSYGGSSRVGGYFKSNGTYVSPHYRSK